MDHLDPKWFVFMIYLVLRMHQLQKYHLHVNGLNASRINGMSHSVRLRSSILPMSGISGGGSNNFLGHLGHQRKVNCINEKKKGLSVCTLPRNQNLYPQQSKITYNSLRWDTLQWCRNRGGQGGHWPPQYLADQLTLLQPGRADYPYLSPLAPPMFFTFRHHCPVSCVSIALYNKQAW